MFKLIILIYICVVTMPSARSFWQIDRLMTPSEVMGIFHTTPDAVPYYELVPVLCSMNMGNKSSTSRLRLTAFNQDIELGLKATSDYLASEDTPLWIVKSNQQSPEGFQYTLIPHALKDIGVPMQDEDSGAAVLAKQRNHELHIFDGFLSADFIIRSLPERLIEKVLYGGDGIFKNHLTKVGLHDLIFSYHHIIYRKAAKKNYESFNITNPLSHMYDIPGVIYPEILTTIDYDMYTVLGESIDFAKQYVVSFWNGVDLRYRVLTNPKIRLNIAGIIIAMDKDAIPYIKNSRVESNLLDADKGLTNMGYYFYSEKKFPWKMYDIAMTNTKLDLCNKIDGYTCDPSTMGYAYVAGACNRNQTEKFSAAIGMAEDDGGFSGIIPTAHELGHLLGAHHDGTSNDTANCPAENGNIMSSTLRLIKNEFIWSNCSISEFHKFLSTDTAKCLYNEPPKAIAVRRILPGKLMSVDDQCKKSYGGGACNKNSTEMCYKLKCTVPETNGLCIPVTVAADGSSCGDNLICLDGECVLEGSELKYEKVST